MTVVAEERVVDDVVVDVVELFSLKGDTEDEFLRARRGCLLVDGEPGM